jgi:hypothetical protein
VEFFRTDRANFQIIETGEGFLKARISIATPGVFQYFNSDGTVINEAKLPEDILSIETLNSAKGVPITDDHPIQNNQHILVDSKNYQQYSKGNISEPRIENSQIIALATIYDSELIKKIKRKEQNQASIGFAYQLDNTPGVYDGKNFDAKQRNIRINHCALVPNGRAGEDIKIHIDKKEKNIMSDKWIVEGGDASNLLTYRRFDGSTDIQVDSNIHGELMSVRNDSKEKQKKIDSLEKENSKFKEQIEKFKTDSIDPKDKEKLVIDLELANDKADEWKTKHDKLEASIPDMVESKSQERFDLISFAKSVDSEMKVDSLSNKEIKLQIISKGLPFKKGVRSDDLSDERIEARYDAACELLRVKATENDNSNSQSLGIDRNTIEEKKAKLKNVYQDTQEKINGGGAK